MAVSHAGFIDRRPARVRHGFATGTLLDQPHEDDDLVEALADNTRSEV